MSTDTRTEMPASVLAAARDAELCFVVVWTRSGARVGEVVCPRKDTATFGRGNDAATADALPFQQRPFWPAPKAEDREPFDLVELSRKQLQLRRTDTVWEIENVGKLPLLKNGEEVTSCQAAPGDLLSLGAQLSLLVARRATAMVGPEPDDDHAFGAADAVGIVGESPIVWQLRSDVAFLAKRSGHVLVTGQSGTGKELVARAIHLRSARAKKPLVSRNAATIPDGLADAELFGNVKGYPNPGMPERPGLVGEAHGSTLFLDEFGELPLPVQAHLLRAMDSGESTRLGEAQPRKTDLRIIAATNRDPSELKEDLLARFLLRVQAPTLDERREDVPLLLRHMIDDTARKDPGSVAKYLSTGTLRVDQGWVQALVARHYTTNARELFRLVWDAVARSKGEVLGASVTLPRETEKGASARPADGPGGEKARLAAALRAHSGNLEQTWRALGLSSRYVLRRLMAKHGLTK